MFLENRPFHVADIEYVNELLNCVLIRKRRKDVNDVAACCLGGENHGAKKPAAAGFCLWCAEADVQPDIQVLGAQGNLIL